MSGAHRSSVLRNERTGKIVATELRIASSFLRRGIGLLGRGSLRPGEALLIAPCNSVHTLFMRFGIDVAVLDADGRVLRLWPAMRPWRILMPVRGGRCIIEMEAGALAAGAVAEGDRLLWYEAEAAA